MKKQILLCLSLVLMSATFSFAQAARTVTNADLEKFRQKRERDEAEYRATYKQRGLPSPEELAQREAQRQKDLAEYAARARAQEQQQQQQYQIQIPSGQIVVQTVYPAVQNGAYYNGQTYYGGQVSGSYFYNGRWYRGNRRSIYDYSNITPHTQLSPLMPNVQINRNSTRIFTTPTNPPRRIYSSPGRGGKRN